MTFAALDASGPTSRRGEKLAWLRRALDRIYLGAAYLAAASMVAILVITIAQIGFRYAGINVRGLSDYAGYFMASSAFLAFAHALNRGTHVRIELFMALMGRFRFVAELLSLGFSTLIAGWFAWYSCRMVYWSWKFNDISTGMDATPLWIPQCSMAAGVIIFTMALADQFAQLLVTGYHSIPSVERGD